MSRRDDSDDEARVLRTVGRLHERFPDRVEPTVLEARVRTRFASFDGAPVREFVPILVEREIRTELLAAASLTARA